MCIFGFTATLPYMERAYLNIHLLICDVTCSNNYITICVAKYTNAYRVSLKSRTVLLLYKKFQAR